MNSVWSSILEIIKFIVPALVVFGTIYYLSKQFFENQRKLEGLKNQRNDMESIRLIKLTAYERLSLFCERIDLSSLAMRLVSKDMTANELRQAMIISVQTEYEHNIAQQIYVSEKLWDIISFAKAETISIIKIASDGLAPEATSFDLLNGIKEKISKININPAEQARKAIRSEVKLIL